MKPYIVKYLIGEYEREKSYINSMVKAGHFIPYEDLTDLEKLIYEIKWIKYISIC